MINFISAIFNEEAEINDLINHIEPYVDGLYFADDGSADLTRLLIYAHPSIEKIHVKELEHVGLPETVKNEALKTAPNGWILMLDADERFAPGVLEEIKDFIRNKTILEMGNITHVYFPQLEIIDGNVVREFQKSKLFKKEAIRFSTGIHEDDQFEGNGIFQNKWVVHHRKSSQKQIQREKEYLETYKRLLEEGKIDEGRYQWLRGLHHYVRD